MDINPDQQRRLEKIFEAWEEQPKLLSKWANEFIGSNQKNFIADTTWTGDPGYFVSPKMWKYFTEFEEKLGIKHEPDDQKESFQGEQEEREYKDDIPF